MYLCYTNSKDHELIKIVETLHGNLFKQRSADTSTAGSATLYADNHAALSEKQPVPRPLRPLREGTSRPLPVLFEEQVRNAISTLRALPSFSSDPENGRLLDLSLETAERILKQIGQHTLSREQRDLIESLRETYRHKRLARHGI